jgi:hypothetical protein
MTGGNCLSGGEKKLDENSHPASSVQSCSNIPWPDSSMVNEVNEVASMTECVNHIHRHRSVCREQIYIVIKFSGRKLALWTRWGRKCTTAFGLFQVDSQWRNIFHPWPMIISTAFKLPFTNSLGGMNRRITCDTRCKNGQSSSTQVAAQRTRDQLLPISCTIPATLRAIVSLSSRQVISIGPYTSGNRIAYSNRTRAAIPRRK